MLTARPPPEDEARAPHRLFGHVDGAAPYNAVRWAEDARATIGAIHAAGGVPILAGGTGLYIRTLLDGIAPVPEIDPSVRIAVRALATDVAYAQLSNADPQAAARLRPSDTTRIARALEVVRATGRTLADWQAKRVGGIAGAVGLAPLLLVPERDALAARINARFEAMLAGGAIEEVEALAARRLDPALPVMRAIGVREIAAWRGGAGDRATMVARAQAASRRYAKRQRTWFRSQIPLDWKRHAQLYDGNSFETAISYLFVRLTR